MQICSSPLPQYLKHLGEVFPHVTEFVLVKILFCCVCVNPVISPNMEFITARKGKDGSLFLNMLNLDLFKNLTAEEWHRTPRAEAGGNHNIIYV